MCQPAFEKFRYFSISGGGGGACAEEFLLVATRHNRAIKPARPFPSGMLRCFTLIARTPPLPREIYSCSHRRPFTLLGLPCGLLLLFDSSFNPKHWPNSSIYRLLWLEPVSESGPRISFLGASGESR